MVRALIKLVGKRLEVVPHLSLLWTMNHATKTVMSVKMLDRTCRVPPEEGPVVSPPAHPIAMRRQRDTASESITKVTIEMIGLQEEVKLVTRVHHRRIAAMIPGTDVLMRTTVTNTSGQPIARSPEATDTGRDAMMTARKRTAIADKAPPALQEVVGVVASHTERHARMMQMLDTWTITITRIAQPIDVDQGVAVTRMGTWILWTITDTRIAQPIDVDQGVVVRMI
jgi:hypothetical protein